jgi:predicted AlkP superfamily phosphohydrolase/phosphomutase
LGLGKIYINLKGRESCGIVEPGREYLQLRDEIIDKFSKLVDPATNEEVISQLSPRERLFSGSEINHAGDIVVAFKEGYRVSWQTALGGFPEDVIEDNIKKWSADHCTVEPAITNGILIADEKFNLPEGGPSIIDLAPTILDKFAVPIPKEMDGRSLLGD